MMRQCDDGRGGGFAAKAPKRNATGRLGGGKGFLNDDNVMTRWGVDPEKSPIFDVIFGRSLTCYNMTPNIPISPINIFIQTYTFILDRLTASHFNNPYILRNSFLNSDEDAITSQ